MFENILNFSIEGKFADKASAKDLSFRKNWNSKLTIFVAPYSTQNYSVMLSC